MAHDPNQDPEQIARDRIDAQLRQAGWVVQGRNELDPGAGRGVAVREYPTDAGPMDYLLMVDAAPVGVIEAKREEKGQVLHQVEEQTGAYATANLKHLGQRQLRFRYECTGTVTWFTDTGDPRPRAREVFNLHRPETLARWRKEPESFRARLRDLPALSDAGLRECQFDAIHDLEDSLRHNRPRALIQMATGAGKTFTAITAIYRLLKHAGARRVLFLVDTRNLGAQAEGEFHQYVPQDDNRKFTELYTVQRLSSSHVPTDGQVCISTIQRMYSVLKGEALDENEEESPADLKGLNEDPVPVAYNERVPPEFFDVIVIDECHRSIYNLWRQVLEYFDSFLVGLTATPDNRTYAFFHQNVVSEYTLEQSVVDGVNVDHRIWRIDTERTREGGQIEAEEVVEHRERLSRERRWQQLDEAVVYEGKQLDRDVVNPNQIRTVLNAFRQALPRMFPERVADDGTVEVPKTLIFAKSDSHADDIIRTAREVFDAGNEFCKKVTYRSEENPDTVLAAFRNDYNPRVAVTVDMIATGTDVKPIECVVFMRDVKSRTYYTQMVGRGTRSLDAEGLRLVTPAARGPKEEFVLVDAVGVSDSEKMETGTLERQPSLSTKNLIESVAVRKGDSDEETLRSLAGRLSRFARRLDAEGEKQVRDVTGGADLQSLASELLAVDDPDAIAEQARTEYNLAPDAEPDPEQYHRVRNERARAATGPVTGRLHEVIEDIKRRQEQLIDELNPDRVLTSDWEENTAAKRQALVQGFEEWAVNNRDELTALTILFNEPHRRRELTRAAVEELLQALKRERPDLAPSRVWEAYAALDDVKVGRPDKELARIVALVRRVSGWDEQLTPFDETVRRNFKRWIFGQHAGNAPKFTEEQRRWLEMVRDHIATSLRFEPEDLDYTPFDAQGGRGRMYQLFGDRMNEVIEEMNEEMVA